MNKLSSPSGSEESKSSILGTAYEGVNISVLEAVIANIPYAIFWEDQYGVMQGCNEMFAQYAGFEKPSEVVGRNSLQLRMPLDVAARVYEDDQKVLSTGSAKINFEETVVVKGVAGVYSTSKVPMENAAGRTLGLVGIFQEITDKKRTQIELEQAKFTAENALRELTKTYEELQRNQVSMVESTKMASLGMMASGLAHEINNPLAIIQGSAEAIEFMIERGENDPKKLLKLSEKITTTVERIAKIILGLRFFARDAILDEPSETRISSLLEDTLSFCTEKFEKKGVSVSIQLDSNLPTILIRPVEIAQVILNLLNNSYDAIELLEERWVRVEASARGEGVEIVVVDSGKVIPAETAARMMEPFFTTKASGKGTGLGLSVSRGIVERHGGKLHLDSHAKNTRLVIHLPSGIKKSPTSNI